MGTGVLSSRNLPFSLRVVRAFLVYRLRHMRFAPLAVAAGAALLALPAAAQTALTPGSADLVAAPPQSYEYDIRFAGETPRVIGTRTLTETRDGDRLVIVATAVIPMGNQDSRDTTIVAWPSLAPLYHASHRGEEIETMAVADGQIRGRLILGNLDEPTEAALPAGAFGPGSKERIARALPFADGYTATVQIADLHGDVKTDTLIVTGQDTFTRPDGTERTVWLVDVVEAGDPRTTYAIDAETREVLRMSFSPRPDMTIEMAEALPPPTGPVLRPGDPALTTSWLSDHTATYTLRVVEPMQMDAGTSTVTRTVADGVVTTETTISVPMQQMEQTVTARADAATLAPLSSTTVGQGAASLAYTDAGVTGSRTNPEGETETIEAAFEAPVFDNAFSSEIAQSLPLDAGYSMRVEAYDPAQGVYSVMFRVTGQEDLSSVTDEETLAGRMAWAVQSVAPSGEVTFYVDGETRELVMMRMSPQPGVIVEMIRQ